MVFNNAEGGTNGTAVTTANSGGASGTAFDSLGSGATTTLTFDNTHAAHKSLSYKILVGTTNNNSFLTWTTSLTGSSVTQVWFRVYLYLTANPSSTLRIIGARNGSTTRGNIAINSSGKLLLLNAAASILKTSTASVPLNQWFRIEGYILGDASVGQMEVKLFSTAMDEDTADETQTTTALQNTGGSITRIDFGNPSSLASYTFWADDVAASSTGYIGPVVTGTGAVKLKKQRLSGAVYDELDPTFGAIKLKKQVFTGQLTAGSDRRISWDPLERLFFQGVSNGVLYPKNTPGVAWSGLVSVTEKGDDASTPFYIDGQLVRNRVVPSTFNGTITAFTYPDEFEQYIGVKNGITSQNKQAFGFSYRSNQELHIVYNALVDPSSDDYNSVSADAAPILFSWDFSTVPNDTPDARPTAHIIVMLGAAAPDALAALEAILYGDDANDPSLPVPQVIFDLFDEYATLRIVDNGDGTWTATADDSTGIISMTDGETFQITWPSAVLISDTEYLIRSL
jgi:hypothetical protein